MLPPVLLPQKGPTTLKTRPWAGNRLAALRGGHGQIGESWEFSTLAGSESQALGKPLSQVLERTLPWLAKLIDTARPLSVQVHPSDAQATDGRGKEEAWVILDAAPGAHVYAGLASGVTASQFESALRQAEQNPRDDERLFACLRKIPVRTGSVVLVPAQTVHAICGGILLAEIQQPSDCTYRFFDYGSGRQLHREQALATFSPGARAHVWHPGETAGELHGDHVHLHILQQAHTFAAGQRPMLLINVSGQTTVVSEDQRWGLAAGDLALCTKHPFRVELSPQGLLVAGAVD